jgi:hypothetical protein
MVASRMASTLAAERAWTGDLRGSKSTIERSGKCELLSEAFFI